MSEWKKSILHLGLGRFHRGHQAVYYEKMALLGDKDSGVVSLSMRSPGARDELRSVDMKYPVIELSESKSETLWVHSIQEALDLKSDYSKVMEYFHSRDIQLITLTITEKGYCLNGKGELDLNHTQIKQDLTQNNHPVSAIGLLARGLSERAQKLNTPVTVLSCDNLRGNGHKLEEALKTYVKELGQDDFLLWLNQNVTFPNTMVDRIVPELSPEKMLSLEEEFDLPKESHLIGTEAFSQWVIEDNFKSVRPSWEKVGVQFVEDVTPFEEMKLRLLNASHSYLAYAGTLKGYDFVHEAMEDRELARDLSRLMKEEVAPLLNIPQGFNVNGYIDRLLERFKNHKLPHKLRQIAMDGSQKIPQRFLPSLELAIRKESPLHTLLKAVLSWMEFCYVESDLSDPLGKEICQLDRKDRKNWARLFLGLAPFQDASKEMKELLINSF